MIYDKEKAIQFLRDTIREMPKYIKHLDIDDIVNDYWFAELYIRKSFYTKLTELWPEKEYQHGDELKNDLMTLGAKEHPYGIVLNEMSWCIENCSEWIYLGYYDCIEPMDFFYRRHFSPEAIYIIDDMSQQIWNYVPKVKRLLRKFERNKMMMK